MIACAPPPVLFQGRRWSADQLAGMAAAWRHILQARWPPSPGPLAMVMLNDPQSVALFFALSAFPVPLILLPLDLEPWGNPPLPRDTRLVLTPTLGHLDAEASQLGIAVTVVPDSEAPSPSPSNPPSMAMPGVVVFTSGSTGLPRPVYRSTTALLHAARTLMGAVGPPGGGGIIATLPLAQMFGLNHGLLAASILGAPLALVRRFDHHVVLGLFASREWRYWAGTPMMADVLSRCPLPGLHPAPPACVIGGHVSADLARRFAERFGVPLRGAYGTTEVGTVTVDAVAAAEVDSRTAGRPLPGVDLRVGDDPRRPGPAGTLGRIWLSSPESLMEGYGFPAHLEPPATVDGWWATPDVGHVDPLGRLTLEGRLDDCFRTDAGHVVSPGAVAAALERYPGLADVAAVALATPAGPVLGVLVESAGRLDAAELRRHLSRSLPSWSQPRVIEATVALPRLSNGRPDRRACIAWLEKSLGAGISGDREG